MLVNITKKLVIVFIIGLLIGAIITTAGFLIFSKSRGQSSDLPTPPSFSQSENSGMPGGDNQSDFGNGNFQQMPGNNGGQNGNQNQPPQMPNGQGGNGMPQVQGSDSTTNSNVY